MKELKEVIAYNLTRLRTANKLTQSELAAKINYSDKSVSKWEHGDSVPPIEVLKKLSDFYGVTLDYIVSDTNDNLDKIYNLKENKTNKFIISMLAVLVVWTLATILYIFDSSWKVFVAAIPISMIILLIFNSIWGRRQLNFLIISIGIWSLITTLYLAFLPLYNLWPIYFVGIPLQIATILWSQLKTRDKRKKHK